MRDAGRRQTNAACLHEEREEAKKAVRDNLIFLVPMRAGVTPVPIPNTMVKTRAADGTMLETVWKSRWAPEFVGV